MRRALVADRAVANDETAGVKIGLQSAGESERDKAADAECGEFLGQRGDNRRADSEMACDRDAPVHFHQQMEIAEKAVHLFYRIVFDHVASQCGLKAKDDRFRRWKVEFAVCPLSTR